MDSALRDPNYLRKVAYSNAAKLDVRVAFWKKYGGDVRKQFGGGLVEGFSPRSRASILEVGCGTGEFWTILGNGFQPEWSVTLSDLSSGMLADARARLSTIRSGLRFLVADVQNLPFVAGVFDAVVANYMLYHLPDVDKGIGEIARVLRADGTLYASTNGENHLREIRRLQERFSTAAVADTGTASHVSTFSLENGGASLSRHFADVRAHQQANMLEVSSVDDLMLYLESFSTPMDLEAVRRYLELEFQQKGGISITRSSGYFVARRPA